MKKLLVVLVLLIAGAVFAQQTQPAQNLGELAKKEKARREALAKEGKTGKVYTKEDLERVKGKLGIETTGDSSSSEGASDDQPATSVDEVTMDQLDAEAAMEQQKKDLQNQLDEMLSQKTDLQKQIDDNKTKTANGILSVNPAQTLQDIDQFDSQMKELERQIQDLQQQIQDLDKPTGEH